MGIRSPAGSIWFQGDWSDPWVDGIANALPRPPSLRRIDAAVGWPNDQPPPDLLILHHARLLPRDAERFASWKQDSAWEQFPATILCYGPFARYAELDRWLALVDVAIPEATAVDTLPQRVERSLNIGRGESSGFWDESAQVVVVSTNGDLRRTLADVCAEWVPRVVALADIRLDDGARPESGFRPEAGPTVTIIDVPLLETGWESRIERASRWGPVIALLGFPDRSTVELAKRLGAWACLELPFDCDDLGYVLRRCLKGAQTAKTASHAGFEPGHRLPRAPSSSRLANPKRPSRRDA